MNFEVTQVMFCLYLYGFNCTMKTFLEGSGIILVFFILL